MNYHSGQRLPAIEDTEEFQRAFRPTWKPEQGYRRGPDDELPDEALDEALALLARDYRIQPGYEEPVGPQGLLPGADR